MGFEELELRGWQQQFFELKVLNVISGSERLAV